MSISATVDLIQAKNATIPGMTYAPLLASYPLGKLGQFPIALTFPIQGQWHGFGASEKQQLRRYRVYVYTAYAHQENYITAKTSTFTLLQAVGNFWTTYTNQNLSYGPTYNVSIFLAEQSDSGPLPDEDRPLTYAGDTQMYHGFWYELNVNEVWGSNDCT